MYNCFFCQKTQAPKTPQIKIPIVTRKVSYPERKADQRKGVIVNRPTAYIDERGKKRFVSKNQNPGEGQETVFEASICPLCNQIWVAQQQEKKNNTK